MKWIYDIKIMTKILISFVLIAFLACGVGAYCMFSVQEIVKNDNVMVEKLDERMVAVGNLTMAFSKVRSGFNGLSLIEDVSRMQASLENVGGYRGDVEFINATLGKTWLESEKLEEQRYKEALAQFSTAFDSILDNAKKGNKKEVLRMAKEGSEVEASLKTLENTLTSLSTLKVADLKAQLKANEAVAKRNFYVVLISIIFCLLFSIIIGIFISNIISKPLKKLAKVVQRLSYGEVDIELEVGANDEIGTLTKAFANMIDSVKEQAVLAEKIAVGDFDINVAPKSEKDVLANSMKLVINTIKEVASEIDYLTSESKKQNFYAVGDAEKFSGGYKDIIEGMNKTLYVVREKIFWYEGILDAIPFPISVTDINMNWTFINKPVENFLGLKRKDVIGMQCDNWNAGICNTENCGIARLRNNQLVTVFEQKGLHFQVDTAYLKNSSGEDIGHIEVVQDITAKTKSVDYQKEEVKKLSENLKLLAQGNLKLTLACGEGNEHTVEDRKVFTEINENLESAIGSISEYINDISKVLTEMSNGNLKVNIMSDYKGDFGQIKESLNNIIESFNEFMGGINSSSEQVAEGARQVSNGSQALSQGATEQASSIEELTATITEVAAQTKANALNANKANELASGVQSNAMQRGEQINEMLQSMVEINEGSKNISKIIKVIDEIAFQTNILALNAAVEAARAGQYGKGFGVVAEEVRNLASRSANAAKETARLIEASIQIAAQGAKKANRTAEALKIINQEIEQVSQMVEEISKSSNEQASAIAQINKGVEQVSQVVQTNSATSEEGAAASEELLHQAQTLKEMVGKFSINNDFSKKTDGVCVVEEVVGNVVEQEVAVKEVSRKVINYKNDNFESKPTLKIDLGEKDFGKY